MYKYNDYRSYFTMYKTRHKSHHIALPFLFFFVITRSHIRCVKIVQLLQEGRHNKKNVTVQKDGTNKKSIFEGPKN